MNIEIPEAQNSKIKCFTFLKKRVRIYKNENTLTGLTNPE